MFICCENALYDMISLYMIVYTLYDMINHDKELTLYIMSNDNALYDIKC